MKSILIFNCICLICFCSHAQIAEQFEYTDQLEELFDDLEGINLEDKEHIIQSVSLLYSNRPSTHCAIGLIYAHAFKKQHGNEKFEPDFKYFHKAKSKFEKALAIDSSYYLAAYAIGQLYYQKAALGSKYFGMDDSKESQIRYNKIVEEIKEDMGNALPFFQKAEKINPNYIPTLIALCEVYARRNNFELVSEFKARIKRIQKGGRIETSFFANSLIYLKQTKNNK